MTAIQVMSSPNQVKRKNRAHSTSPIKSRFSNRVVTSSIENCPISDPTLGIISENDHRVGQCLCKFCECGKHICPNPLAKEFYPNSTFTSKYKADYRKNAFDSPLKPEPISYRPTYFKMDLKTSNQEDYKFFTVSPQKKQPLSFPASTTIKPPIRSAYSNDFLDWGANGVYYESRFHPPLRTMEIPFRGQSSYRNSFRSVDPLVSELYRTKGSDVQAAGSTFALGPKESANFKTTYGDKMQDYSGNELNRIINVHPNTQELFPNVPQKFQTTSQSFHKRVASESKDPRTVRLWLNKKLTS